MIGQWVSTEIAGWQGRPAMEQVEVYALTRGTYRQSVAVGR